MVYNSILIADDHDVVRGGLAMLVKDILPHVNIIQAGSLDEAIELLNEFRVDLMLCDINMPGGNRIDMIHHLKKAQPDLKILVVTAYQVTSYEKMYRQAGANGFISKTAANEEIQQAVISVLQNGHYTGTSDIARESSVGNTMHSNVIALLSHREIEVCRLLIKGTGITEIADRLSVQPNTVSTYKKRIFTKLGVSNLPELISLLNDYPAWQID
jgi:two-component system, NarL family, invasion response regulator UvrY